MRVLAAAVIVGTVAAVGAVSATFSRLQSTDDERLPRGTFVSLVSPADYPASPHRWPAGAPIVIECWGGAEDQQRTRRLARAKRAANRLEFARELASAKREVARMTFWRAVTRRSSNAREKAEAEAAVDAANAELERVSAEWKATASAMLDMLVEQPSFTLRTANGTRYGWNPEHARSGLPFFRDVGDVFPEDRVFDHAAWNALRAAEGAVERAKTPDDILRAGDALRSAKEPLSRSLAEQDNRNALRDAIRQDALEACAR